MASSRDARESVQNSDLIICRIEAQDMSPDYHGCVFFLIEHIVMLEYSLSKIKRRCILSLKEEELSPHFVKRLSICFLSDPALPCKHCPIFS